MNPPYSQDDHSELEFTQNLLKMLQPHGKGVVVVPMSCAIGTKFKEERKRLFANHTLKAVFSMPDEMFYSNNASTNVCVMVWEAHTPHDSKKKTFFGFYKDDGYVKRKKIGRVDSGAWESIRDEWIRLYNDRAVEPGGSALQSVDFDDEWLAEAYISPFGQDSLPKQIFYDFASDYLLPIWRRTPLHDDNVINVEKWADFSLAKDISEIRRGKRLVKEERSAGDTPFVTAGFQNQGIAQLIGNEAVTCQNVVTIDMFGNSFYRDYPFAFDDNIVVLRDTDKLDKFSAMFLATIINVDKFRYGYGRQYRQKDYSKHIIKLPADKKGQPDWEYMSSFMKSVYTQVLDSGNAPAIL
jgi:hypothetical protein